MRPALGALLIVVAVPTGSPAQPAPEAAAPAPELVPPRLVGEARVPYPKDAPPHEGPVVARLRLRIDATGRVTDVELLEPVPPAFARALDDGARRFEFEPARYGGTPVAVDIRFTQTFLPPAPPPPEPTPDGKTAQRDLGPSLDARLDGSLQGRGTRRPISGATVAAIVGGRTWATETDAEGSFSLPLPAGEARVEVVSTDHARFRQLEEIAAGEILRVGYLLDRLSYDPYSVVVVGRGERTEVARTELRGKEIRQIPGTFGDPFRVIHTLPGVASVMSLLPFPVVRGASPSNTGFLIDGVRVPLLFHLLAGPSVIHPEMIDAIHFFPGVFPVEYGGYTGGIVDGQTRRARPDERRVEVDVNLLQAGALVRRPLPFADATVTAAGRIGYPGLIISLANEDVWLSYWDYQARVDGGSPSLGWTVFVFGASDTVEARQQQPADGTDEEEAEPASGELEPVLRLGFHRIDLRWHHDRDGTSGRYQLVAGMDDTLLGPDAGLTAWHLEPRVQWATDVGPRVRFQGGLDGSLRHTDADTGTEPETTAATGSDACKALEEREGGGNPASSFTDDVTDFYTAAAFAELLWHPHPRVLVRPGFRSELYQDRSTRRAALDPRLTVRYRLSAAAGETDAESWWLKGGAGLHHQPPRFLFPLPGLDQLPLRHGLLQALQTSLGIEAPLAKRTTLDVTGFFHYLDPVLFDLQVNQQVEDVVNQAAEAPWEVTDQQGDEQNAQEFIDRLFAPQIGRSYGLEVLLRRRSEAGVYGWLSATLSSAQRYLDGDWVAFDYDRTVLLNLVVGIPLPRSWEIGGRVQYQSGKPVTTTYGYNTARVDPYLRFDVRVDKRAIWNDWMLDFYVDIANATLYPEEVAPGSVARYVLPTVGFRAVF